MKWIVLPEGRAVSREGAGELAAEYRAGRSVGTVTLGRRHFFFRRLLTAYCLPYGSITRYFRRVALIPAKLGCCNGEIPVEHVVICGGEGGGELAQIQMPGERAALALMEELSRRAPEAPSVCLPRGEEAAP